MAAYIVCVDNDIEAWEGQSKQGYTEPYTAIWQSTHVLSTVQVGRLRELQQGDQLDIQAGSMLVRAYMRRAVNAQVEYVIDWAI